LASLPAPLAAEDAILLPQVRERLPFPTIQPPGQNRAPSGEPTRRSRRESISRSEIGLRGLRRLSYGTLRPGSKLSIDVLLLGWRESSWRFRGVPVP
jgi:hypothetical protein